MHISPFSITRNLLSAMPGDATCADRLVACILSTYANNETGELWPHVKAIATLAGMQPRGVQYCLAHLEQWGLLATGGRHVKPGGLWRTAPAQRRLVLPGLAVADEPSEPYQERREADVHDHASGAPPCTTEAPTGASPCMASGAPPCRSLKGTYKDELTQEGSPSYTVPQNDSIADPPQKSRSLTLAVRTPVPPGFDQFWDQYPRKVGKEAARKAWAAALLKASVAMIMAGLGRQLSAGALDRGRFTPHPATWLNQGRWDDDPAASANLARDTTPPKRTGFDALKEIWERDHPRCSPVNGSTSFTWR